MFLWCVRGRSSLKSEPKVISEGGGVHPKGKPTETDPCKRAPELKPRYLHLLFMCSFSFIFFLSFFHYTHLGSRWFCKIPRGSLRRISYLFVYWYAGKSLLSKRNPRQILFPFFINHHFRGRRPEGTFCKHDTTG